MTKLKVTRVALYVRHATPESREDQLRLCRQRAAEADYEIVGTYQDEGSANLDVSERPGLRALLEEAGNRKVDIVLMDTSARLTRIGPDLAVLSSRFEALGMRIVTIHEEACVDPAMRDLIRRISDVFHECARQDRAARSRRSIAKRVADRLNKEGVRPPPGWR